ncbi:MAG: hypothetical protein AAFX79_11780 [Planctomycetota bacterium]
MRRAALVLLLVSVAAVLALPAGCRSTILPSGDGRDPVSRLRAITRASDPPTDDEYRFMVSALRSDDGALRVLAIAALERSAGERFGYHPYSSQADREVAVGRWEDWLRTR